MLARTQHRPFLWEGDELGAAFGSINTRRTDAEITVSLLPVMAARWLIPRLPRFTARFPRINLHIKTGQSLANFKSDGVDIAIRFGTGEALSPANPLILRSKFTRQRRPHRPKPGWANLIRIALLR